MENPEIDEETLKKLPYWREWLYRTAKEICEKQNSFIERLKVRFANDWKD